MNKILELFGMPSTQNGVNWEKIVNEQHCIYLNKKCYKVRKSDPSVSIGACSVSYGNEP